jgi:parallel beta-helix repeat protein
MTASGTYPVSVITPRGSSNELSLFITIPSLSTNELSVKDYGAKGDGVTDDAPAIQAVFDRVKESGGAIYFPAGTYLLKSIAAPALAVPGVTTPIERSAVMVRGEKITLRGDGASSLLKTGPDLKAHAIEFYFAKDITVKDLSFDGNKTARDRNLPYPEGLVVANIVSVVHGSRVSFTRVNVMNGIEDGIGFWKSEDGSVTDSYIHDNGTAIAGAAGVAYSASKRGTIARNTIVRNTAVNISASFGSDTVTIEDNIVQGSLQDGILIGSEAPVLPFFMPNTNMTVRRNTVSGNGWQGIDVIGVDGATIDQNTVLDNKGVGINLVDQDARYRVAHVSVTQNRSSNTTGRTQQDGIYARDGSDIVIRGNTTEDNGTWIGNQIVVDSDVSVNSDWETANTRTYTPPRTASSTPVSLPPTTSGTISFSPTPTSTTDRQGRLALVSLAPSFAAVGETVTLTGTGFTTTGNTILFGSGVIPRVESKNGTTLSFVIPQTLDPECAFATPSCKVASQQTVPGTYAISVKNERGTSAPLTLTVVNPEKLSREQLGAMLETARAALQALLGR